MTVAASPPELEGEITYIIMIFHAKVNESLPEGSVSLPVQGVLDTLPAEKVQ